MEIKQEYVGMLGLFISFVRRFKIIVNSKLYQTTPVGVQLFSYVNTLFCSNKFAWLLDN